MSQVLTAYTQFSEFLFYDGSIAFDYESFTVSWSFLETNLLLSGKKVNNSLSSKIFETMKVDTGLSDTIGVSCYPSSFQLRNTIALGKQHPDFRSWRRPAGWDAVLRALCSFTRYWLFHCGTIAAYRLAPIFPRDSGGPCRQRGP